MYNYTITDNKNNIAVLCDFKELSFEMNTALLALDHSELGLTIFHSSRTSVATTPVTPWAWRMSAPSALQREAVLSSRMTAFMLHLQWLMR